MIINSRTRTKIPLVRRTVQTPKYTKCRLAAGLIRPAPLGIEPKRSIRFPSCGRGKGIRIMEWKEKAKRGKMENRGEGGREGKLSTHESFQKLAL